MRIDEALSARGRCAPARVPHRPLARRESRLRRGAGAGGLPLKAMGDAGTLVHTRGGACCTLRDSASASAGEMPMLKSEKLGEAESPGGGRDRKFRSGRASRPPLEGETKGPAERVCKGKHLMEL